jgi:hypothetical protein
VIGHQALLIGIWYQRAPGPPNRVEGPASRARRKEIRRNRLRFLESGSGKQDRTGPGKAIAATGTDRPPIAVVLAKVPTT